MFRILVVDDDPVAAYLLRKCVKNLPSPPELFLVGDGAEALDFLYGRRAHTGAPRPNLILLDLHMPYLDGIETLAGIKGDPWLRAIPVIMFSTSDARADVHRSYQAYANCYVQKTTDLEQTTKFIQCLLAFWGGFALLPPPLDPPGPAIAQARTEATSRAMNVEDGSRGCQEHERLLDALGAAVKELLKFHEQQFKAIIEGDTECNRFDLLIHMANEQKQQAKYAYLRHVESHGCANSNALDTTRT
jgi:CheY-like chemotaxis protein